LNHRIIHKLRGWVLILCCLVIALTLALPLGAAQAPTVQNVILFIGDGMGPVQVEVARQAAKLQGQKLNVDRFLVTGEVLTSSANQDVTDSAAAATALATGQRTNNGMIAVTPEGARLTTILEWCRDHGRATGLVTTDSLTGATPAAFAAHAQSRRELANLSDQIIAARVDVLLGGGESAFRPKSFPGSMRSDERDLVAEAQRDGYTLVSTRSELGRVHAPRVLGLFAPWTMAFAIDRRATVPTQPSLTEMTRAALRLLSADRRGFFLMVEGGKIDPACHWNDGAAMVPELLDFDRAVGLGLDFARTRKDTLVVVTADHETGGLRITDPRHLSALLKVTASCERMQQLLNKERSNADAVLRQYAQVPRPTTEQLAGIVAAKNPGVALGRIIGAQAGLEWTRTDHSSRPVLLFGYGPSADACRGKIENAEVGKRLRKAVGASP